MKRKSRRSGGSGMMDLDERLSPKGMTCDLRLVRHATVNIKRYWEDLEAGISFNLISNWIGNFEKKMNCIRKYEKKGVITWPKQMNSKL